LNEFNSALPRKVVALVGAAGSGLDMLHFHCFSCHLFPVTCLLNAQAAFITKWWPAAISGENANIRDLTPVLDSYYFLRKGTSSSDG